MHQRTSSALEAGRQCGYLDAGNRIAILVQYNAGDHSKGLQAYRDPTMILVSRQSDNRWWPIRCFCP
jgi:hypothetical protein